MADILIANNRDRRLPTRNVPEWPSEGIPKGWLPVGIAGVPGPVIRWMYFGSVSLIEPFFHESVDAKRSRTFGDAGELETDLSVLISRAQHSPHAAPAGLICHMSRCGSTLLLNALRAAESVVGLGEPQPFGWLLNSLTRPSQYWRDLSARSLVSLHTVFANYMDGPPRSVVIKGGVSGAWDFRAIRSIWPNVPCIFTIRNPVEVLVSNLWRPPQWVEDFDSGTRRKALPPPEVLEGTETERIAWNIGRLCQQGLEFVDDRCGVVDYKDITPEVVMGICRFFGLRVNGDWKQLLTNVLRVDAKDRSATFSGDSSRKQASANAAIRECADRWVGDSYRELRKRSVKFTENLLRYAAEDQIREEWRYQ